MKHSYVYIAVSVICAILNVVLVFAVCNGDIGKGLMCLIFLFLSAVGAFCTYTAGQMEVYDRIDKWMTPEELVAREKANEAKHQRKKA